MLQYISSRHSQTQYVFSDYNWNAIVNGIDHGTLFVYQAFADFVAILHYALEHIVGYRTVTVRERNPPIHTLQLEFYSESGTSYSGGVKLNQHSQLQSVLVN